MKFKIFIFSIIIFFTLSFNKESKPIYLDSSFSDTERVEDLLSRMTIEEKVAQMCQYVGLNYLKSENESSLTQDVLNSDSKASYKGFLKKDIAQMVVDGEIGSFLHVLQAKESNLLQTLALKSRLKIPLIIGIDAIHGNGMVKGTTVYPSPISICTFKKCSSAPQSISVKTSLVVPSPIFIIIIPLASVVGLCVS